eukprot:scaffold42309_cov32-Phaeocystis_antarctica.AAC.1
MQNLTRPDLYRRQSTPSGSVQESSALLLAMATSKAARACPCRVRTREAKVSDREDSRPSRAGAVEAH